MRFIDMTEEQKASAIEKNRYMYTNDSDWYQELQTEFEEDLEKMGFGYDIESQFSGFSSQGDGASFTTKNVNIEKVLRYFKMWNKFKSIHRFIRDDEIKFEIYRRGRYVHSNTMNINDSYYFEKMTVKQDEKLSELYNTILCIAVHQADVYYRKLEDLCNWYESDEFLTEHFEINEYSFCEHHFELI